MKFNDVHHLTGAFLLSGSTFSALNLTPMEAIPSAPLPPLRLSLSTIADFLVDDEHLCHLTYSGGLMPRYPIDFPAGLPVSRFPFQKEETSTHLAESRT